MIIITILLGSYAILPLPTVYGSDSKDTTVEKEDQIDMGSLGKEVKFLGESTVALKQIHLIPTESGQVLFTTIEVNNKSTQELDFYPYWIKMQTNNGGKFPVSIVDGKKNSRILPSAKETFSYYAIVPKHIKLSDLVVKLIKWDFAMLNYERQIHTFTMPAILVLPTIESGESYVFDVQGIPVRSSISNIQILSSAKSKKVSIKLSYLNQGLRAVILPTYEYMLKDAEGVSYPVALKVDEAGANMLPRIMKETDLTAEIPLEADINDFILLISEPKEALENSLYIPLVNYKLEIVEEEINPVEVKNINEVAIVKYNSLDFHLSIRNLRVLPTSSFENVIAYDVVLKNLNDKRVAIPNLSSHIFVTGKTAVLAKLTEKKVQLMYPEEEIVLNMVATFPENIDFNGMTISFQIDQEEGKDETKNESKDKDLATFKVFNRNFKNEKELIEGAFHFSDLGRVSTIKFLSTSRYDYWGAEIIVSTFLVENKDIRPIKVPEYTGFYKSTEGELYTASYQGKKDTIISPRRSAIVTYWAELPNGMDISNLELVLGQPLEKTNEVLIESATFLAIGDTIPKREIRNHSKNDIFTYSMFPYNFKIKDMKLSTIGEISAQFYLEKSFTINVIPNGEPRTLTFEVLDAEGTVLERTKEYNIETELNEGINNISFNVQKSSMGFYGLSVRLYENFGNGKGLIGTFSLEF